MCAFTLRSYSRVSNLHIIQNIQLTLKLKSNNSPVCRLLTCQMQFLNVSLAMFLL